MTTKPKLAVVVSSVVAIRASTVVRGSGGDMNVDGKAETITRYNLIIGDGKVHRELVVKVPEKENLNAITKTEVT